MVGGVPHPAVRLADLRAAPLDVAEVVAALDDPSAGGLTVFVGRVRDHDGGRPVTALDYAAHPTALTRLVEICDAVAERYDVTGVAALHRTGALEVGDPSVVVAATAAHRGVTFDATRALIDTLKAEVPIWKRQVFADGAEEWVGSP